MDIFNKMSVSVSRFDKDQKWSDIDSAIAGLLKQKSGDDTNKN